MAKKTFANELIARARCYPRLYLPLRDFYRAMKSLLRGTCRFLFQRCPDLGPALGFYSGLSLIRNKLAEGTLIAPSQIVPNFSPDSLVKWCGLQQDGFQPWPIFWIRIPNARLCGSSLVPRDAHGKLLAEATFSQTGELSDPAYDHFDLGRGAFIEGNATSIVSRWGGHGSSTGYWHWLFDSVSRLALLDRFPADTRVITPPLSPWMSWFLQKLGLRDRVIETTTRSLRVENFYFSSPTSMTGCWNPHAVDFLRRSFLPYGSPPSDSLPKRFYILREGFTRAIANEQELMNHYVSLGWALVAPEKYSIPDQIALFRDAEGVAGLHGSALTNLLWCSPRATVQEFVPDNFMAGAFEWLSVCNKLRHSFMICKTNSLGKATVRINEISP
jgi:hypothetical protein